MNMLADPRVNGILLTYHDITKHKQDEEKIRQLLQEKELILKEVHHRIKNNMNTIGSLLSLQASTIPDTQAARALGNAKSRIQSMMVLYDMLYQSGDYGDMPIGKYLPSLVDQITANFPHGESVSREYDIDDFVLSAKLLQPVAIIINELVTNTMKYAFGEDSRGQIFVSAAMQDNHVSIVIRDNGKAIPESINFGNTPGFGLMLVDTLTQQLKGSIRIERGTGTAFILEFDK
jgi:two-component sensor histidine kinase